MASIHRMVMVLGCAAGLAACSLFSDAREADLHVRPDRTTFVPGRDTLTITAVLRNSGDAAITVSGSGGCILGYQVTADNGVPIVEAPVVCIANLVAFRLEPGDSLVRSFRWFGQTFTDLGLTDTFLEPGTYRLHAQLNAVEGRRSSPFVSLELLFVP